MPTVATSRIEKTPGFCGGKARVGGTRIPVWLLVLKRKFGQSDADILADYPTLVQADLDAVWEYYGENALEVERTIWRADIAANVPEATTPPAWVLVSGRLLGLSEDEVRDEFDPPVPAEVLAAAWREYRADPVRIAWQIAHYRTGYADERDRPHDLPKGPTA
ncbi:MAG: DUF433 domain-containing protein [Fimbriiglobus sp.]